MLQDEAVSIGEQRRLVCATAAGSSGSLVHLLRRSTLLYVDLHTNSLWDLRYDTTRRLSRTNIDQLFDAEVQYDLGRIAIAHVQLSYQPCDLLYNTLRAGVAIIQFIQSKVLLGAVKSLPVHDIA